MANNKKITVRRILCILIIIIALILIRHSLDTPSNREHARCIKRFLDLQKENDPVVKWLNNKTTDDSEEMAKEYYKKSVEDGYVLANQLTHDSLVQLFSASLLLATGIASIALQKKKDNVNSP